MPTRADSIWAIEFFDVVPLNEQEQGIHPDPVTYTYGPFESRDDAYKWGFRVCDTWQGFRILCLEDPATHPKERKQ